VCTGAGRRHNTIWFVLDKKARAAACTLSDMTPIMPFAAAPCLDSPIGSALFPRVCVALATALLLLWVAGYPARPAIAGATPSASGCSPESSGALKIERFAGEAAIEGDDTPIRAHFQLCEYSDRVTGLFTTEDNALDFVGRRVSNRVEGMLASGSRRGTAQLTLTPNGATGSFEFDDQKGKLQLKPTSKSAADYIHPPERLDLTPAQWTEDLNALVEILTTKHGSPFTYVSKQAFMRRVAEIQHKIPKNTGIENALEFRKLAALIGDGHTQVDLPKDRPVLPLETFWFNDGIRVVAAPPDHPELLGAKLISVNKTAVGAVVEGLTHYFGQHETPNEWRRTAPLLLVRIDLLNDLNITKVGANSYRFDRNGRLTTVQLTAGPRRTDLVRFSYKYPLWQRNPDRAWWETPLPDGSTYVNWRGYDDLGANSAVLMRQLDEHHPKRLLIDLRDNGGGDYNVGRQFIDLIVKRPWLNRKGVLYVLAGRRTFSAAMTNAVDFLKDTNATLVGETIGAKPNGWQESRSDYLPNSGLEVSVSIRYYSFLPGASEVRSNIYVSPRLSDWSHELDAAVRRILAL